jgi:ABC-type uncharacterized transport system ATPase subunit
MTIHVSELRKYFSVHKKIPGMRGAITGLLHRRYETVPAVDGISFDIGEG